MTHDEGQALRALVRTIEANQAVLLRRVEELEHRAGVAAYAHSKERPVRDLGDYFPAPPENPLPPPAGQKDDPCK